MDALHEAVLDVDSVLSVIFHHHQCLYSLCKDISRLTPEVS
jgi:hypothetical protein